MAHVKEKCPNYDPKTGSSIVPGKSCLDYNTPKGCRYAHPWEPEWDGINDPLAGLRNTLGRNPQTTVKQANSGINDPPNGIPVVAEHVIASKDRMEVDGMELVHVPAQEKGEIIEAPKRIEMDMSGFDESDMEDQAMRELLMNISLSLFQSRAYKSTAKRFADYKRLYRDYHKTTQPPIDSEGVKFAWKKGQRDIHGKLKSIETLREGWLESLEVLSGGTQQVEGGEDQLMIEDSDESNVLRAALKGRKERMQLGPLGERIVDLRVTLDEIQQAIGSIDSNAISASSPIPMITGSEDVEMGDAAGAPSAQTASTPNSRTAIRNILKRMNELEYSTEEAEQWALSTLLDEDTTRRMRAIIEGRLSELGRREGDADIMASLENAKRGYFNKKNTAESLARVVDARFLASLEKDAAPVGVEFDTLKEVATSVEKALKDLDNRKSPSKTKSGGWKNEVLTKTVDVLSQHMVNTPAFTSQLPPSLTPSLDTSDVEKRVQEDINNWMAEYDKLKELGLGFIQPIVNKTTEQLKRAEDELKARHGVGSGSSAVSGGLVALSVG